MSKTQFADIVIIGGGLNGLAQALALVVHGVTCPVTDRADQAAMLAPHFDGRVSAISSSSMKLFEAIGLGPALEGKGCPIEQIWVSDGLKPGSLDFVPDADDGYLGQMFENQLTRRALYEAALARPEIQLHMPAEIASSKTDEAGVRVELKNGDVLTGSLLVVAEGRKSVSRDAAGIRLTEWDYAHEAMVTAIFHEEPHKQVAYEIFYPTGPFAILPMLDDEAGRHRSAIVWSVSRAEAPVYKKLSPRGMAHEIEKAMGGLLGDIEMNAPVMGYPLNFQHANRVTDTRMVLVGDAAHGMHPIAGQGLNLGLRDVACLAQVVVEGMRLGLDPGDTQILERYTRWRSLDVQSVMMATDPLNKLFGIPGKTASAARRLGLAAVQRMKPLKDFFMAEARGESGNLPKLLQGLTV
ncbi:FAD-dependent monooxygenase [uncultured Sphingorhabdus sp.]|uniref:FAD-dependent monooxygenase n=1 Tax=uncultured Sphingorhabdus sp. TaxID=1686106 RepID=UPI00260867C5|nr:FAD-dependent monooxygenase [uncultured Sphingorhabdus sp.]